jgi:hypothetical protein
MIIWKKEEGQMIPAQENSITPPEQQDSQSYPLQHRVEAARQAGISDQDTVSALLESLARQETLNLGAAPNSPIHKSMILLAQKVWELAQSFQEGQNP